MLTNVKRGHASNKGTSGCKENGYSCIGVFGCLEALDTRYFKAFFMAKSNELLVRPGAGGTLGELRLFKDLTLRVK
jgi:hypothetical protein